MATYTLTPDPYSYFTDDNGHPLVGGLIYTYAAGTSSPATTYANASGTANSNPVVLDAAGRAAIYLDPTLSYKYLVKTSAGALVRSADNILGVPTSAGVLPTGGYDLLQLEAFL